MCIEERIESIGGRGYVCDGSRKQLWTPFPILLSKCANSQLEFYCADRLVLLTGGSRGDCGGVDAPDGDCRVEMAGAPVSPLGSPPKLLDFRGRAIEATVSGSRCCWM